MSEKVMHFANFNITFGDTEEPMLSYFESMIFPAFTGGYQRGKAGGSIYSLQDVKVLSDKDGDLVCVGHFIKDTHYRVHTTLQDGQLVSSPAEVPTAPYSRFIIFLKNHRMILVRNEPHGPDIRSFQATVRDILNQHRREMNKEREAVDQLPFAMVNIVDIPLREDIETILSDVDKVNWLKLRFFPLNNDLLPSPLHENIMQEMDRVDSKTANMQFNTPGSKAGVQQLVEQVAGLANTTMRVTYSDGQKRNIRDDSFSSNKKIQLARDISEADDGFFISVAKENDVVTNISPDNQRLYDRLKDSIARLLF